MTGYTRRAAIGGILAFAFVAAGADAAPLGRGADAMRKAAVDVSAIEQVHGCHRACVLGRVPRWGGIIRLHRQVGPNCVPVRC